MVKHSTIGFGYYANRELEPLSILIAELSFANSQLLKNCNVMNIEPQLIGTESLSLFFPFSNQNKYHKLAVQQLFDSVLVISILKQQGLSQISNSWRYI